MKITKKLCDFCGVDITDKRYATIDFLTQESGIQSLRTRERIESNDVCLECIEIIDNSMKNNIVNLRSGKSP